jgi:transcription elongation factor GreA
MPTVQMPVTDLDASLPKATSEEVAFGSTVSFTDRRAERDQTFKIVASYDAKPQEGTLSINSPVASALLHRRTGDLVEVPTPSGLRPLLITAVA